MDKDLINLIKEANIKQFNGIYWICTEEDLKKFANLIMQCYIDDVIHRTDKLKSILK